MTTIRGNGAANILELSISDGLADEIFGRGGDDRLRNFTTDPTLERGGYGDDFLLGGLNTDRLYGDAGNDVLEGGGGLDFMFGGRGDDIILTTTGWAEVRGGVGDDVLNGRGALIGGSGNDDITIVAGTGYGDEAGVQKVRGADVLFTDHSIESGAGRAMVGGLGADTFGIRLNDDGAVATRTDVLDFRNGVDHLAIRTLGTDTTTRLNTTELFALLDTDGNGTLDGHDPATAQAVTWADPIANAVCVRLADGDMLAVWNTQHIDAADWVMV